MSSSSPLIRTLMRPSCGRRFSAMSMPDMTLMREMSEDWYRFNCAGIGVWCRMPSTRNTYNRYAGSEYKTRLRLHASVGQQDPCTAREPCQNLLCAIDTQKALLLAFSMCPALEHLDPQCNRVPAAICRMWNKYVVQIPRWLFHNVHPQLTAQTLFEMLLTPSANF